MLLHCTGDVQVRERILKGLCVCTHAGKYFRPQAAERKAVTFMRPDAVGLGSGRGQYATGLLPDVSVAIVECMINCPNENVG
jgi:hypothetical protein